MGGGKRGNKGFLHPCTIAHPTHTKQNKTGRLYKGQEVFPPARTAPERPSSGVMWLRHMETFFLKSQVTAFVMQLHVHLQHKFWMCARRIRTFFCHGVFLCGALMQSMGEDQPRRGWGDRVWNNFLEQPFSLNTLALPHPPPHPRHPSTAPCPAEQPGRCSTPFRGM